MKKQSTWIDFREAIRITVRLMPDGDQLAAIMDDNWIGRDLDSGKSSYTTLYDGECYAADSPAMVWKYGEDWRKTREKVIKAYNTACAILQDVLSRSIIAGEGHCEGENGRRPITESDWAVRDILLSKDILFRKLGTTSTDFPTIIGVRVNAADVRRECAKAIAASRPKAKASGISACREWLLNLRSEGPQPKKKPLMRTDAEKKFGVTERQFNGVWKSAADQVPNPGWGKGGRPRK